MKNLKISVNRKQCHHPLPANTFLKEMNDISKGDESIVDD